MKSTNLSVREREREREEREKEKRMAEQQVERMYVLKYHTFVLRAFVTRFSTLLPITMVVVLVISQDEERFETLIHNVTLHVIKLLFFNYGKKILNKDSRCSLSLSLLLSLSFSLSFSSWKQNRETSPI